MCFSHILIEYYIYKLKTDLILTQSKYNRLPFVLLLNCGCVQVTADC
jgi:hypothetical protein